MTWLPVDEVFEDRAPEIRIWNRAELEPYTNRVRAYVPRLERSPNPDAPNGLKTHCPVGHEYTQENTYRRPDTKGRECMACRRNRRRERRENGC